MTSGLLKSGLMQGTRLALVLLLLALISTISATSAMSLISPAPARAQTSGNQAGLVVVHGDGRVVTRCVAFSGPQISGADLVFRSGLSLVSSAGPLGLTVCSLNGEGCPSTDCFCECHGTPCVYWNYHHGNRDGLWTYANIGAASRQITNGDVDAWLWGESSQLPPSVAFDEICGQASLGPAEPVALTPPVQQTPVVTASPEVVQTTAPAPTETPAGAEVTATPTSSPTPEATAIAVVTTSTPAPTAMASPTPTLSPVPKALDSSGDGSIVSDVPASLAEPARLDVPKTSDSLVQGRRSQIVAFVAVLSIVGGASALLSRRSRAK